ncbi:uncharacterized protein CELE_F11A6.15 [Caenorhabditis elegans]|uniref:Uncharacterized protein n=1 Tax=Caenorhabditis elegans TaxID=6239 RepID=A0A1T5HUI2_CAEEL|nr:Uncharacterized protein CELE_F11A6.15 [Caenorhabditis elegans]SKC30490.1 Uncharacterized protein CELE_F11A6.15 [Caenorhabditis elegans]|eukprot:NP_001337283.1 Uncharacterized protein CELE_F11A6.15 [Caenorhabditis elegans]
MEKVEKELRAITFTCCF